MKAIILGAVTAVIAVTALSVPANAFISMGGSSASTSKSNLKMEVGKPGSGFYMSFENATCRASAGSFAMGLPSASKPNASASASQSCDANEVVNNPPANSTVTINGLCDADAAKAKANITGSNVTVVVNSTGPCKEGEATKPAEVVVTTKTDDKGGVKTASATTNQGTGNGQVTLPETGLSDITLLTGGLAVLAYGATLAARAFRARA